MIRYNIYQDGKLIETDTADSYIDAIGYAMKKYRCVTIAKIEGD